MKPTCCGKPATPYRKEYGMWQLTNKTWVPTFEEGFRCKRCGRIRIPWTDIPVDNSEYLREIEELRKNINE